MKQKILVALKTKFKTLGFSDKAFDGVADYLSKTVTEESQIETATSGVERLLKVFQGDVDFVRNEKSGLQKQLDELKEKYESNPTQNQEQHPDLKTLIDAAIAERLTPVQDELNAFKQKGAQSAREALIASTAKDLGIPEWRINEGFSITDQMDETAIKSHLTTIKQNIVAAGLERAGSGFPLSDGKPEKSEVDEIVSKMIN